MAYRTKQGQTWDQIALDVYGKELYADYLMEQNPKALEFFIFPEGVWLQTPPIPEERTEFPPWRLE